MVAQRGGLRGTAVHPPEFVRRRCAVKEKRAAVPRGRAGQHCGIDCFHAARRIVSGKQEIDVGAVRHHRCERSERHRMTEIVGLDAGIEIPSDQGRHSRLTGHIDEARELK
jgi:hypothetical protein